MSNSPTSPSRLERQGLRFFQRLSERYPRNFSPDDIHVLNPAERQRLKTLQRDAVIRAGIAGGVSAALGVVAGILLEPMLLGLGDAAPWEVWLPYFGLVTGISVLVTFIEIGFLYWDALRTVHRISAVAGLELFPTRSEGASVALALVRAALELPNPPDDLEGVNPRREISKFRFLIGTLIYKLKATATNFILKALIRRIVGRSAFRTLIEFVAVPVYGAWNALICYWVLKQARIRAMGPSAATEFLAVILRDAGRLDEHAQLAIFRAAGAAIVRTVDLHPNLVSFMQIIERRLGDPGELQIDDSQLFLDHLATLPPSAQVIALRVLVVASIIDGRIALREKELLEDALAIAGYPRDASKAKRLCKAFVRGDDIGEQEILDCLPAKP
jgi:hypothetical protein